MNNIGVLYADGRGVPRDDAEAMRWYRQAADKGDAAAMNNIGHHYASGNGVAKDCRIARVWLEKAAKAGFHKAEHWLKGNPYCAWR